MRISFDQAVAGAQVPLSVSSASTCATCHGTGAKPGTAPKVCPRCQGRGIETQGQGMFSISQPCSQCGGEGTMIEDPCPTCHGSGAVRTMKRYRVNIPAGVKEGSRIRLPGKGEPGRNGGPPGDLYVIDPRRRLAGVQAQGRQPRGRGAAHDPRGDARRRGAGADAHGHEDAARKAGHGARHGAAPARRGAARRRAASPDAATRGDIHYRFTLDVPEELSGEQQKAVEALSKTMNGNPRARLFENAGAGASGAADGSAAGAAKDGA